MNPTINGATAIVTRVVMPGNGAWYADLVFGEDPPGISGRVALQIGADQLIGTVDPTRNGIYRKQRKLRMVGGANGWSNVLPPRDYHSDAGVKAATVAHDAAAAAGETLGGFVPTAERLGADYVRAQAPASRTLEDAAGGAKWWVDPAGVTQVGTRSARDALPDAYDLQSYDPRTGELIVNLNSALAILPGYRVTSGLDMPVTAHAAEITIVSGTATGRYLTTATSSRVADAMTAIVDRLTDGRMVGLYRYRVLAMVADRVNVQVVRKRIGLPNLLTISMWPGVAGMHATLTPGAEVLVQFIDGDRAEPAITNFAGRGASSAVPQRLEFGGQGVPNVAYQGGTVRVLMPPMVFNGTIGGTPAAGVLAAITGSTLGTIETGSSKMGVTP